MTMSLIKGNRTLNAGDSRSSKKLLSWTAFTTGVLCLMLLLGAVGVPPALATDGCFRQMFENVEVIEVRTPAEARALATGSSAQNVVITVIDSSMIDNPEGSEAWADLMLCPMDDDDLASLLDQEEPPFYIVNNTSDSSIVVIAVLDLMGPKIGYVDLDHNDDPPPCTTVLEYTFCP
jgi:hypothetical protein